MASRRQLKLGDMAGADSLAEAEWALGVLKGQTLAWPVGTEWGFWISASTGSESVRPSDLRRATTDLGGNLQAVYVVASTQDAVDPFPVDEALVQFHKNPFEPKFSVGLSVDGDGSDAYIGATTRLKNALQAALAQRHSEMRNSVTPTHAPTIEMAGSPTPDAAAQPVAGHQTPTVKAGRLSGWVNHPWTVTVVGGVIVAVVVALLI